MSLANSGRAADEEWIVGLPWQLGDCQRRGVSQPVGVADYEVLKAEPRVAGWIEGEEGLGVARCLGVAGWSAPADTGWARGVWLGGGLPVESGLGLAADDLDGYLGSHDCRGTCLQES